VKKNKIQRALVSVFDKNDLKLLANYFVKNNIEVLSTGGTFNFLKNFNKKLKVIEISKFTNFDEILDGRVKSLHPKIHSGILAKKNDSRHQSELERINAQYIDLVVVNLYPFEKISQERNSSENECIENIDIGGPTLLRGAAKNFKNVTVLCDPSQYKNFLKHVELNQNTVSENFRHECAKVAFEYTSYYESKISNWFNKNTNNFCSKKITLSYNKVADLRYGENPHQKASYFKLNENQFSQVSGKELSYNNIYDSECAIELAQQFTEPSCVILKHGNPCGVAIDSKQENAYQKALECDRTSAFGGIVAFNKMVNLETAKKINKIFTEVVIAPKFSPKSKKILSSKRNLILIEFNNTNEQTRFHLKTTRNFLLMQEKDNKNIKIKELSVKSKIKPKEKSLNDMLFAFTICKYLNSNAIVIVSDLTTIAIGVGQTSRLDSAKIAIDKVKEKLKHKDIVMASDGFFPFPDIVELCSKNQIAGIIQPGGSKNDRDVINAANKHRIPLVFTGIRHFKH